MATERTPFDVVISGASFAGLALARALSHVGDGALKIAVVSRDAIAGGNATQDDARAFALSASSRHLLEHLGCWTSVAEHAQPVTRIEITDSSLEAGVRPVLLSWDNLIENGDPASHIVPAPAVLAALTEAVHDDANIKLIDRAEISARTPGPKHQQLTLSDGRVLDAKLVAAADGQKSKLRDMHGLKVVRWDHKQRGIVTTITHSKPHNATAIQHFLPGGPFAILPLIGDRSCITWSDTTEVANRLVAAPADVFKAELDQRLAGHVGAFDVTGPRQSWPLSTHLVQDYIADRFAVMGDAAHGVHPIAGQGLNLGLRDVAALTDVVMDAVSIGLDFGRLEVLEKYQRWRRSDSALSALTFDGLNRLFSNDTTVLRSMREVGLGTVDQLQGVKSFFVSEAAGQSGELPTLLRKAAA